MAVAVVLVLLGLMLGVGIGVVVLNKRSSTRGEPEAWKGVEVGDARLRGAVSEAIRVASTSPEPKDLAH